MIIKIGTILIAALVLFACHAEEKLTEVSDVNSPEMQIVDENQRINNTVLLYNSLLAKGYRNQNMTVLSEVATEQRALKAYYHMAALGEGKVKMDSKLVSIVFNDVKILSDVKAEAGTSEKWEYKYINFDTQNQEYENTVDYKLRYSLVKKSGKWLVDYIDLLETKEKNPETYKGLQRQGKSD